jgi:Fucose 4-O-acetylase and related acetyltransferases
MRGFTMILVVYSHICGFCLGDTKQGFNDVFFLFRLPCFFFISGWLFEKVERSWNNETVRQTIKHKFMVQIVPTFIFLLLLAPPPLFFSRLGATKGGYWFTFALFEFFLLCIFSERYLKRLGGAFALVISASAFCYDIFYNRLVHVLNIQWITDVLGFLSFMTWRYFLFFYIGTWVKRHFELFVRWTNKPSIILPVIIGFVLIAMHPHAENGVFAYLIFAVGGVLGLTLVFTLFRLFYSQRFSLITHRSLEYIGSRTLDIYLLHYFFLPRYLLPYGEQLRAYDSKVLELVVALLLALAVVVICLVVSYVIRLCPFLGRYLFGVTTKERK